MCLNKTRYCKNNETLIRNKTIIWFLFSILGLNKILFLVFAHRKVSIIFDIG